MSSATLAVTVVVPISILNPVCASVCVFPNTMLCPIPPAAYELSIVINNPVPVAPVMEEPHENPDMVCHVAAVEEVAVRTCPVVGAVALATSTAVVALFSAVTPPENVPVVPTIALPVHVAAFVPVSMLRIAGAMLTRMEPLPTPDTSIVPTLCTKFVVPEGRVAVNPQTTVVDSQTGAQAENAEVSIPDIIPMTITCPKALFAIASIATLIHGSVEDEFACALDTFGTFPVEPVTYTTEPFAIDAPEVFLAIITLSLP